MDKTTPPLYVAALSVELSLDANKVPERMRVIPDGEFTGVDGRPGTIEGSNTQVWRMDAALAQQVIAEFKRTGTDIVIDYEHQTLKAADNGKPAPAAGWITVLEYVPGTGLVATVKWTDAAAAHLAAGEYRYLSPVFVFDRNTGAVLKLISVALLNQPALGALGEIAALAAQHISLSRLPGSGRTTDEESTMDKTKVLVALGLPLDTGDDTALAQLSALTRTTNAQATEIAALKANQFDPAKHIPLTEHTKITTELAALKAASDQAEHDRLMTAALAEDKISTINEAYWREQPLAALQAFLKDAKPLPTMRGTQTGGKAPAGAGGVDSKDPNAISQAALAYQTEQAKAGISISTAQAVAHVTKGATA